MGFEETIHKSGMLAKIVQSLYRTTRSRVRVNGIFTDNFLVKV